MKRIDKKCWSDGRFRARALATVLLLSILSGCATGGKLKPEQKTKAEAATVQPPDEQGPTITRLEDGRDGFVIREAPEMDSDSRAKFERAVVLMQEEEYEEAVALLEPVVETAPEVTAPYVNLALAYLKLERTQEAEEYLQIALALFPDHPVAGNAYGLLLRRGGRFDEARAVYEQTLSSFPEYLPARKNLGILCDLYLDDPACALQQYEIYFEAMPEEEQIGIWIASLRLRIGRQPGG